MRTELFFYFVTGNQNLAKQIHQSDERKVFIDFDIFCCLTLLFIETVHWTQPFLVIPMSAHLLTFLVIRFLVIRIHFTRTKLVRVSQIIKKELWLFVFEMKLVCGRHNWDVTLALLSILSPFMLFFYCQAKLSDVTKKIVFRSFQFASIQFCARLFSCKTFNVTKISKKKSHRSDRNLPQFNSFFCIQTGFSFEPEHQLNFNSNKKNNTVKQIAQKILCIKKRFALIFVVLHL